MQAISEATIYTLWQEMNDLDPDAAIRMVEDLSDHQPLLVNYLIHTGKDFLTAEEQEFFMFLGLSIYLAFEKAGAVIPEIQREAIEAAEQRNASMVKYLSEEPESDILNTVLNIWKGYNQRGLLRFLIETIVDDEENNEMFEDDEHRAFVFIGLKTLIDCLDAICTVPEN
ncbi:MAG: hypothetical protein Q9P14_14275 [candidate division KSB1 bacterium]|nr:hypothetical protein [candidate division KSB1 bacterium]MDQ7066091.1 hypothetical protein [candidate division KSB1 bacterium]